MSGMRSDPQRDAVYAAERESADNWGPHFARTADAQRFVDAVLADPAWVDQFPDAPLDVPVSRRSTSARYSAADVESGAIHLTSAGLCGPIVLHELAHLADHSLGNTAEADADGWPPGTRPESGAGLRGAGLRGAGLHGAGLHGSGLHGSGLHGAGLHVGGEPSHSDGRAIEPADTAVEPHGARFVGIHLMLVRRFCGFHAYGDYRAALDRHGVRYEWPVSS